jgi:ribosomal protein S18 acetylase RimI-like enzyme
MTIRPATAADVPGVLPMVAAIYAQHEKLDPARFTPLPDLAQRYSHWLTARLADTRSVFLVAQQDENLVAFLVATVEPEIPIYRLSEYGFIHDLWVEPEYRHEGIARQMTMLAVERFVEMGLTQVRLDTASANDAARSLFVRCGFRESTRQMLIELPPGDKP